MKLGLSRPRWPFVAGFVALSMLSLGACSSSNDGDSWGTDGAYGTGGATSGLDLGDNSGSGGSGFGGMGGVPEIPEVEIETAFRAPVATGKYLWTANPVSGRVALVNVETLEIDVFSAGLGPTYLARVPRADDSPSVVVQNVGSSNVSWFRKVGGSIAETKLPTNSRVNRFTVSEDGRYVLAWAMPLEGEVLDSTEGLQDLVVLDLGRKTPTATRLTVGYRPSQVVIASDNSRACVVSEEGLTLVDLGDAPKTSGYLGLGSDAGRDVSIDVSVTHALVRREGSASVAVIDLDDETNSSTLTFSGAVTDLDLTPGGLGVAAVRSKAELAVFRLEEVLVDPAAIDVAPLPRGGLGSVAVSPAENTAVAYTNATTASEVVILDLEEGTNYLGTRVLDTTNPVHSITVSDDGFHAVVTAGTTEGAMEAFSVLSLVQARFPRIVGTKGKVSEAILSNGVVLVTSATLTEFETTLVSLPGLSLERVALASRPISAGILLAFGRAYAAQDHPEGRITFYGTEFATTGKVEAKTVTGFELSADVVNQ